MLKTYRRFEKRTSRLDVSSTCRMCLSQNISTDKLVDIFIDEPLTNVSLIKFCTGIECEENDSLPSKMCYDCYSSLTMFFAFKRMCISSEKYFKSIQATPPNVSGPLAELEAVEPKEELPDEFSLAENSDMGLLETDCIDPGAPEDVLFQIKKCEEDYQLAHPDERIGSYVLPDTNSLAPAPKERASDVEASGFGTNQQARDDVRMMIDRDFGDFGAQETSQPAHHDLHETSMTQQSIRCFVEEYEYTAQGATEEPPVIVEEIVDANSSPVIIRMEEKKRVIA